VEEVLNLGTRKQAKLMWIFLIFCKSLLGKQALSLAFVEIHFISVYMSEPVNETVPSNGFDF
jgi:hypothetical protein